MTYRKFKADYLFLGDGMAAPDSVLITTAEGIVQSVVPAGEAGEGVEVYDGVLTPGFVNCHCHLELSHLRGVIPEGTGLVDFLSMVIGQRGREGVRDAIAAGEREMLDNGIVAVGDICNTIDTLEVKRAGRMRYRNFIETAGFVGSGAAMRFEGSRSVYDAFEGVFPGLNSIVPHAPYSVSGALFRLIADFEVNELLTIHNQESAAENAWMKAGKGDFLRLYEQLGVDVSFFHGTGQRSLASFLPYFHSGQSMILVHNVATAEEDLREAEGSPAVLTYCLCPNANLYIGGRLPGVGRLPDVGLLARNGCRIVVGTDSLASNKQLSILAELATLQGAFPWLETEDLLRWGTLAGAEALGMEAELGSFDSGKRPGVVLLDRLRLAAGMRVRRLL